MARYLNPKNDLTFKQVFGEHVHLCMSLLNSMLPFEKNQKKDDSIFIQALANTRSQQIMLTIRPDTQTV